MAPKSFQCFRETGSWPGLAPRMLDQELRVLTMRPPHIHQRLVALPQKKNGVKSLPCHENYHSILVPRGHDPLGEEL